MWLVVTGGLLPPILLGLALTGLAATLRPRLGSHKQAVAGGWVLPADSAVSALVARIAEVTGAPRPHVIVVDLDWNASVEVVGLRRTRVLRLGVPLLLALDEQQQVAVIGHELGHLKHDDSLRALATMPALTVFWAAGRVDVCRSSGARPPASMVARPAVPRSGGHGDAPGSGETTGGTGALRGTAPRAAPRGTRSLNLRSAC